MMATLTSKVLDSPRRGLYGIGSDGKRVLMDDKNLERDVGEMIRAITVSEEGWAVATNQGVYTDRGRIKVGDVLSLGIGEDELLVVTRKEIRSVYLG